MPKLTRATDPATLPKRMRVSYDCRGERHTAYVSRLHQARHSPSGWFVIVATLTFQPDGSRPSNTFLALDYDTTTYEELP